MFREQINIMNDRVLRNKNYILFGTPTIRYVNGSVDHLIKSPLLRSGS